VVEKKEKNNNNLTKLNYYNIHSAPERAVPSEKRYKPRWNRPINGNATPVGTMSPSNEQRFGLGELQTKKKHHIFAPTAGAHYAINFAWW